MNSAEPSEFYRAMHAYAETAMCLLREACRDRPPVVLHGLDEWRRDPDGVFRLYDREEPFWVDCLRRHDDRLHALDEYRAVVEVLRTTPYASELLDQLVGSVFARHRIEASQIADEILWRMAHAGGLGFDEDRFVRVFQDLDADLRRRQLSFVWLVPLLGMKGPRRSREIDRLCSCRVTRSIFLEAFLHPSPGLWEV